MILPNTQNLQIVTVFYNVKEQTYTEYFESILCIYIDESQIKDEDEYIEVRYITSGGFVMYNPLSFDSEANNCHLAFVYDPILEKYIRNEDQHTKVEMQEALVAFYETGIRIRQYRASNNARKD